MKRKLKIIYQLYEIQRKYLKIPFKSYQMLINLIVTLVLNQIVVMKRREFLKNRPQQEVIQLYRKYFHLSVEFLHLKYLIEIQQMIVQNH